MGGKENWLSIQTKFDSSILFSYVGGQGNPGDTMWLTTVFMRPNLQKTLKYQKRNKPTIVAFDGHVFWTQNAAGRNVQTAEESRYFLSSIMLGLTDVLLETENILYKGIQKVDGREFEVLQVKRPDWLNPYLYFFDRETGLLQCAYAHEAHSKRKTYFKDYRIVSGVRWPFVEEVMLDGKLTDRSVTLELRLNLPMERRYFEP